MKLKLSYFSIFKTLIHPSLIFSFFKTSTYTHGSSICSLQQMTFSVFQQLHAQAAQQPAFAVKPIGSNRCINYETPIHTQHRNFIEDEFQFTNRLKSIYNIHQVKIRSQYTYYGKAIKLRQILNYIIIHR
jgi:hypothetical protein